MRTNTQSYCRQNSKHRLKDFPIDHHHIRLNDQGASILQHSCKENFGKSIYSRLLKSIPCFNTEPRITPKMAKFPSYRVQQLIPSPAPVWKILIQFHYKAGLHLFVCSHYYKCNSFGIKFIIINRNFLVDFNSYFGTP